ncbi:MAG TPA: hypothetical protein VGD54_04595, partial [Steroidobacteraceae bacterium]
MPLKSTGVVIIPASACRKKKTRGGSFPPSAAYFFRASILAFVWIANPVAHATDAHPSEVAKPQDVATQVATQGYAVQELRDHLYWVTDGSYNTMFVVST